MATSIDVGQYVYSKLGWVDAWRLEKLTYYAQAWYLAWDGRRLVEDKFEAWADGPVAPQLHRVNKYDRGTPWELTLPGADLSSLDDRARAIIDAVLDFYGSMTKDELIELTHSEMPWLKARAGLPEGAWCTNEIEVSDMRRCYTKKTLSSKDIPAMPAVTATIIPDTQACTEQFSAALSGELSRWSDALALLAER